MEEDEIEKTISKIKAIWEIENMPLSFEEESAMRDYLEDKISGEEYLANLLNPKK